MNYIKAALTSATSISSYKVILLCITFVVAVSITGFLTYAKLNSSKNNPLVDSTNTSYSPEHTPPLDQSKTQPSPSKSGKKSVATPKTTQKTNPSKPTIPATPQQTQAPSQQTPPPAETPPATGCTGALHAPGGPDGFGSCWPSEANTGVPSGVSLTNYTGSCTIATDGAVIDKKIVNCDRLLIKAKNITITKSRINSPIIVDSDDCGLGYSFKVSDSKIHVSDINYRGLLYCNYTATRVNVSGGQSMAWCDSCTIQDSYLHSPLEDPEGAAANHAAHNSTVRVSANAYLRHNTLWCAVRQYDQPNGQDSSGCSANQTAYSHDGAPPYNSTIERNLYMPTTGGFCAYGGSTSGNLSAVHHIVFKDNVFKRGTSPSDHGEYVCGYYGAVTGFDSSRPGNQWVNNRWDDGTILNP